MLFSKNRLVKIKRAIGYWKYRRKNRNRTSIWLRKPRPKMTAIDTIATRLAETDPALAEFRALLANHELKDGWWKQRNIRRRNQAVQMLSERGFTEQADIVQNCQRRPNRKKDGKIWIQEQIKARMNYIRNVAWAWTQV